MRRFRFRRRRFGSMVRRARPIVRAASGITLAKRIQLAELTLADITSADFDAPTNIDLLECTEAMDEEAESDGTTIADAPLYSRIIAIKAQFAVTAVSSAVIVRYMLVKLPDGESTITNLTNTFFHNSNDDPTSREIRKNTLAKGMLVVSASSTVASLRIRVSRQALKRVSPLRENDRIRLILAKAGAGTTATVHGFGTIWVRANA